jgi:hypothetical protein
MLLPIQIQLENDPTGAFGKLASLAGKQRAQRAWCGAGTDHHSMAQLLEESAIGRIRSARDIEEDVVLHAASFHPQRWFEGPRITRAQSHLR